MTGRARRTSGLVIASSLILAACSSSGKAAHVTSHPTYSQARAQVHAYLTQALDSLPAGATLSAAVPDNPVPCSDSDGAPASTPVSINATAWVAGLPNPNLTAYLQLFVDYWVRHGWKVSADQRPGDQFVALGSPDGYHVVMELTVDGKRASISGSTPCVAPIPTTESSG